MTAAIDEENRTILRGNTYPLARAEFDRGAAPASVPMTRMLLVLNRSAEQESALEALLDQQQAKGSPNYHASTWQLLRAERERRRETYR